MTPEGRGGVFLRLLLRVVNAGWWLAPPSRRREWRRQWRADIWHESRWVARTRPGIAARAALAVRTLGALRHALWLRGHVRRVEMLTQDLRYGWRLLLRTPGFTAVAIVTLGIGIGANLTVFSLVNAVLLRPLASYEPDRVVRVVASTGAGAAVSRFSYLDYLDLREQSHAFSDLSAVSLGTFVVTSDNTTEQILGEIASGRYLSMLGATMTEGRTLTSEDDRASAAPAIVISSAMRERRFGTELAVGRELVLNGRAYTVVGVADRSVIGSFIGAPIDAWMPIATSGKGLGADWSANRSTRSLALIGRLASGMSPEQARGELQRIVERLTREFPPADRFARIEIAPGTLAAGAQRRLAQTFLSLLFGLVALVLLVACANVGNLLLARTLGRKRELAIRVALGAHRSRLVWMLLTESSLIAGAGGLVAVVLSLWTSRALAAITPLPTLSLRLDVRPDLRVIGFAIAITIVTAAVLALAGAYQAMRARDAPALREDTAASVGSRGTTRLRASLATLQITVSLVLLIGAALFLQSARHAEATELGFDPRGVLVTDLDGAAPGSPDTRRAILNRVLQRIAAIPGVAASALSTRAPLDSSTPTLRVSAAAAVAPSTEAPGVSFLVVSPEYFNVVRTPIVAGRAFTDRDDATGAGAAIVNETLASRLWPDGDALGRRLWLDPQVSPTPATVVGIARNSKYLTLGEERQGHLYLPFAQHPRSGVALLVRSALPPDRLGPAVQNALHSIDPNMQGFFTRTLTEHVGVSLLPVRLAAKLATIVAGLALALSVVGLYSLISYIVAERTHEIGVRMALGADRRAISRMIIRHGLTLTAMGLAIGVPTALALSRVLGSLLYGVSATDPVVFTGVSGLILVVSIAACYAPARRATRLDPLTALRRA